MNYNEAKLQQLNAADTYRVYGQALQFDQDTGDELTARRRRTLIQPCLCVQDSPDNPCPCNIDVLWWLEEGAIVAQGKSGRKDHRGKELQFFDVRVESTIMVESIQPVSVSALKRLGRDHTQERLLNLGGGSGGNAVPGIAPIDPDDILVHILGAAAYELLKEIVTGPSIWDLLKEYQNRHPK